MVGLVNSALRENDVKQKRKKYLWRTKNLLELRKLVVAQFMQFNYFRSFSAIPNWEAGSGNRGVG